MRKINEALNFYTDNAEILDDSWNVFYKLAEKLKKSNLDTILSVFINLNEKIDASKCKSAKLLNLVPYKILLNQ